MQGQKLQLRNLKRRVVTSTSRNVLSFRNRYLDKFIFIHINKTGGSSVEKALNLSLEHKTVLEKIEEVGKEQWSRRYTFTVVRNPWDKVVSHYHYRLLRNRTDLATNPISFKEWVHLTYGAQDSFYYDAPKLFMPQVDWLCDRDGKIVVDFICRFENLNSDFANVCARLNLNVSLPHVKASNRGHYTDYYDEETSEIVKAWFKKDIETFGYVFG